MENRTEIESGTPSGAAPSGGIAQFNPELHSSFIRASAVVTYSTHPVSLRDELRPESKAVVKTLLRNAQTGLYVQSAQDWTGRPDEAYDFKTMRRAIQFAEKEGFRKMELAFVSDHLQCPPPVSLAVLHSMLSVSNRAG